MSIQQKTRKSVGRYVNSKHVDTVLRTYKKERWAQNSERLGKADSLSAWFSLEEIERFIETIKIYQADGIKFYFGAYNKESAPLPEYEGLQTIILVATKTKETEAGNVNKDLYFTENGSTEILAYNAAFLCPPFCRGGHGFKPGSELGSLGIAIIDNGEKGLSVI